VSFIADRYADAYGAAAEAYARVLDPTLAPVARRIVELTAMGAGDRILDLATGTGAVARAAAATGAAVVGVDVSPGMVSLARSRSSPEILFVVGDAAQLRNELASFDAITCGFGFSHMPDIEAVLHELRRVLRRDGILVEASWGSGGANPAFAAVLSVLEGRSHGALHAFAGILDEGTWADASRGAAHLRAAGFSDVHVLTEPLRGQYVDPDAAFDWTLAWPDYGETARRLGDGERMAFRAEARSAVEALGDLSWEFAINYYVASS